MMAYCHLLIQKNILEFYTHDLNLLRLCLKETIRIATIPLSGIPKKLTSCIFTTSEKSFFTRHLLHICTYIHTMHTKYWFYYAQRTFVKKKVLLM